MKETTRILVLESKTADYSLIQAKIRNFLKDCTFEQVKSRKDFLQTLKMFEPDIILANYDFPHFNGLRVLELAKKNAPLTPVIISMGTNDEEIAVNCMRAGASNYILKENFKRWESAFIRALEERHLLLERKQAEKAIASNERQFKALIENGRDNISLLAADGTLLWESPATVRDLGYAQDEFKGRNILELIHPEDQGWTQELFGKLIQNPGGQQEGTFRLRHANNSWRWAEAIATNLLDEPSVGAIVINYRDITDRKKSEGALRNSEERFRLLFDRMLDGVYRSTRDGKFTNVNPAMVKMFGYASEEEMLKVDIKNDLYFVPEERGSHILDTGKEETDIYRMRRKDGSEIWVEDHGLYIHDEQGNVIFHEGILRDITARRQAEVELQNKNDDLELISIINEAAIRGESLDAIVVLLGKEMKRIFSSVGSTVYMLSSDRRYVNLQQYSMTSELTTRIEQLIGSSIPPVQIPIREGSLFQKALNAPGGIITSEPEGIQKWIEEFIETPSLPSIAKMALRKLVPQIYKLLNIKSIITIPLVSDGKTIGILDISGSYLFSRDDLIRIENITGQLTAAIQRQQAEEQLQLSKERFHQVADNIQDVFWITDARSGDDIYISPAAEKVWGCSPESLMNDPNLFVDSVLLEDRDKVLNALNKQKRGEKTELEYRIVKPDGSVSWIWDRAFPVFDDAGNVVRLAGIAADITDTKVSRKDF